jgi:hypothetical protein
LFLGPGFYIIENEGGGHHESRDYAH